MTSSQAAPPEPRIDRPSRTFSVRMGLIAKEESRRRARKAHQCDLCGGTIQSGAVYHWWTCFEGDDPWHGKSHLFCGAVQMKEHSPFPHLDKWELFGVDGDDLCSPEVGAEQLDDIHQNFGPFEFDLRDAQPNTWETVCSWFAEEARQ